jgi:hypothetical protein
MQDGIDSFAAAFDENSRAVNPAERLPPLGQWTLSVLADHWMGSSLSQEFSLECDLQLHGDHSRRVITAESNTQ